MEEKKNRKNERPAVDWALIFAGAVLLGIASFWLDGAVQDLSSRLSSHAMLLYVAQWLSNIITVAVVLAGITSLFLFEERKSRWVAPLWLCFALAFLASAILKLLFERLRPVPDALSIAVFSFSFPSAHAAVAFAVVPVLEREFPLIKWFWLGFAALIGLSRILLGVHWLSDVVWGGLLGYLVGKVVVHAFEAH